jgi:uncharacterized protein YybS (DUF2232 family)
MSPLKSSPSEKTNSKAKIDAALIAKLGAILRLSSLAVLFAGSAAIVFAAITLVKIGEAKGLTVSAAATANAPIFLHFAKVTSIAAVLLLIAEVIDNYFTPKITRLKIIQYIATGACCLCVFAFSFVIAPQMMQLLPDVASNKEARQSFCLAFAGDASILCS